MPFVPCNLVGWKAHWGVHALQLGGEGRGVGSSFMLYS